jgi:septum formation protein
VRLILASASPRRSELLHAAGIPFDVSPAEVDESLRAGEGPDGYVRRVSETKALSARSHVPGRPVLGADTVVLVGSRILGKPRHAEDAGRMLRALSGVTHEVLTGVCLLVPDRRPDVQIALTAVEFADLSDAEISWYVGTGEPMDKAGAYAIQGHASRFVTRIEGSYSNVVGLPVALVYEMCRRGGILLS